MLIENSQIIILVTAIPVIILFMWTLVQQFSISYIKKNQKILFNGSKQQDLEGIIANIKNSLSTVDGEIKDLYEITNKIHSLSHKGLHKVGLVRFNPFRDIGGDQSFSVALLDGKNNGIVISSLYSRDGVRVYAKQLENSTCQQHQLTEEEKRAISIASPQKKEENKRRV